MTDRALVATLEERLVNAWPSFEIELMDGWLLRFAEGYSKRANAASPLRPGAGLDAAGIAHVEAAFEARGIPVCFRLTGLEDPGAEAALDAAGYADHDPSLCLVADLDGRLPAVPELVIRPAPKPAWIAAAAAAYGGEKANADRLGRIVRLIRQPAAFGTLLLDGEEAAFGLAVAERGWVGLYDIVVAPDRRGLGLGRRLVAGLLAWGQAQGAGRAYLQVRDGNAVALALYGSLGFRTAYAYRHRVAADRP